MSSLSPGAEACCELVPVSFECAVSDKSETEASSDGVSVSGIKEFSSLYVLSCSDKPVSSDWTNVFSLSAVRLLPAAIKKQSSRQIDIFRFLNIFMLLNCLPFKDIVFFK